MVLSSFSASFFFLFLVVDKLWKSFFRIFKRGRRRGWYDRNDRTLNIEKIRNIVENLKILILVSFLGGKFLNYF